MFPFAKKSVEAKLVGSNLVASLHSAQPPLVWQLDLMRNHSFTVALQGDEGEWELGLTSPKGEFYPVAHFPAREDAEEALAAVQKILMKSRRSEIWNVLGFFLMLILAVIVVLAGGGYILVHSGVMAIEGTHMPVDLRASPIAPAPSGDIPQGVPMPADQILKAPH